MAARKSRTKGLGLFAFGGKAVHAQSPLNSHGCALCPWQKPECKNEGEGNPSCEVYPEVWTPEFFDDQHERHHDVANCEDGKIGRCIISPLVVQVFFAMRASGRDSQIGGK